MKIVSAATKVTLVNIIELTTQHFKTDAVDHSYSYQQAEYQGRAAGGDHARREEKDRERQRRRERQAQAEGLDEDEALRRAIEESKQTAAREERQRVQEAQALSRAQRASPA